MAGHILSFVNDELKAPLGAVLDFAVAEGIATLEMRSIDGRNFIALSKAEQIDAARAIREAGLDVRGLASPLLKWAAPGRTARELGDQFGFDLAGRALGEVARQVAGAAHILGTRDVRIFSFLTHDGFTLSDLDPALDELLALAEREDLVLHVENEPVCNVRSVAELAALMRHRNHPRLRALLDIGNAYWAGHVPADSDLLAVMPFVDAMHFKDYDSGRRRVVALGEGEIPYGRQLGLCLAAAGPRSLRLSIETHVPEDQPGATRRSIAHLRSLLAAR